MKTKIRLGVAGILSFFLIFGLSPDTTAPTRTGIATNAAGTLIIVSYNETLGAVAPQAGDYVVTVAGTPVAATAVAINGQTVEITVPAITNGQVVTLGYNQAVGREVQDAAGNLAADFAGVAVNNTVPDTTAPTRTGIATNAAGTLIIVSYNETLGAVAP
ncbi:MAG: hypothetical protein EBZ61_11075, partial [Micrococcales bacterium]|nr:hypothetical protein [Micrococcales bacterium]